VSWESAFVWLCRPVCGGHEPETVGVAVRFPASGSRTRHRPDVVEAHRSAALVARRTEGPGFAARLVDEQERRLSLAGGPAVAPGQGGGGDRECIATA